MHGNAAKNAHNVVLAEVTARLGGGRVLDAPCGGGSLARRMAATGLEVTGLDVDEPAHADEFAFLAADLDQPLPVADESVDAVVSVEGIEHLKRPFDFVRECARALRAGGLLIMTTPNISSLRSRWRWFMTGFHNKCKYALDETNPNPLHHVNMLSYPELRYMLHTSGFRIEKTTTNRMKGVNWLYAPLVPVSYVFSRAVIAAAKERRINRPLSIEILHETMKPELLFGELVIVVAHKRATGADGTAKFAAEGGR